MSTATTLGFHHVAIRVRDFEASRRFYVEALGFSQKICWGEAPKRAVMLDTGAGDYLEIFERPNMGPAPEGEPIILHFALRTDDTDTAIARARAAGAVVTIEPKDVTIASSPPTPVRLAFCQGPDGEVIEFFQNTLT